MYWQGSQAPCNRKSGVIYRGRVGLAGMINAKFIPYKIPIQDKMMAEPGFTIILTNRDVYW